MLTGQALLDFVDLNKGITDSELAAAAGFTRVVKSGKTQVLTKKFYATLLNAKGCDVSAGRSPGKAPKYATTVHRSGVILLGRIYAERFGVEPGDQFTIHLDDDCIRLVPAPAAAATEDDAEEEIEAPVKTKAGRTVVVTDAEVEELVAA
jgi:hypothetical protein